MRTHSATLVLGLAAAMSSVGAAKTPHGFPFSREDPTKIVGPEKCGKCHVNSHAIWLDTAHASKSLTSSWRRGGKAIARNLGMPEDQLMVDIRCLTCHFTARSRSGNEVGETGVTCESCHGAAKDWVDIHHETWDEAATAEAERKSLAAGMRRPEDLYAVASNCFQCHIVPFEDLVNVGGHSPASSGFEFVEFFDQVRHNFLESLINESEVPVNEVRPTERRRVMYLVGRALALEYALRALATASRPGSYYDEAIERLEIAIEELEQAADATGAAWAATVVERAQHTPTQVRSREILPDAEFVRAEIKRYLASEPDGGRLPALDELMGTEEAEPEPVREPEPATSPDPAPTAPTRVVEEADARISAPVPPTPPQGPTGKFVRHVHRPSPYKTVNKNCGGCHEHKNHGKWLKRHVHSSSLKPFKDSASKNTEIALAYGIRLEAMRSADQVCMDCHGFVVSGKPKARKGVDCQSCHGPAKQWVDSHKDDLEGSYAIGMRRLDEPSKVAELCTSCHFIQLERLIAAGHPRGDTLEGRYAAKLEDVKHWQQAAWTSAAVGSAFKARIAWLGPVPNPKPIDRPKAPRPRPPDRVIEPARTPKKAEGKATPKLSHPIPVKVAKVRIPPKPSTPDLPKIIDLEIDISEFPEDERPGTVAEEIQRIWQRLREYSRQVSEATK